MRECPPPVPDEAEPPSVAVVADASVAGGKRAARTPGSSVSELSTTATLNSRSVWASNVSNASDRHSASRIGTPTTARGARLTRVLKDARDGGLVAARAASAFAFSSRRSSFSQTLARSAARRCSRSAPRTTRRSRMRTGSGRTACANLYEHYACGA